jgi:hypothetical protein
MHTVKIVAEIVGGIVVVGILLIVLFGYEVTDRTRSNEINCTKPLKGGSHFPCL